MREKPHSQRAHLWAWVYVQLFGTAEDTEDDDSETSGKETRPTDTQPSEDEPE